MKLALAGDTMLGRGVAERLAHDPQHSLFAPELVEIIRDADLFVLKLECCISARGEPFPGAVFHFRAPPWATEVLVQLGVDCVTLANNHALDFGADALVEAGATIVAGHSAHVFHGVAPHVLYDLGDFIDDYRVDPTLQNDLGLLFLVDLNGDRLEAIPLKLEFAHTRLATGHDAAWIARRFTAACAEFGTEVAEENGRLVARWR